MEKVRLVGAAEIQDLLGVTRTRVHQITRTKGFPEPYVTLRMGSVWAADEVEAWIREHRPKLAEEPEGES
jgi:prophage regulatory protein